MKLLLVLIGCGILWVCCWPLLLVALVLLPFLWLDRTPALVLAIVLSGLVLFGVGVYSAVSLTGDWRKSGLTFLVIGLGAAGIGFLIGRLFHSAGA